MFSVDVTLMKFKTLTDEQWEYVQPLLPPHPKEGKRRADDRQTINAILYVLNRGIRWNDLPEEYGDDSTANRRLNRWEKEGVWIKIMDALESNDKPSADSRARSRRRERASRLRLR